MCFRIDRIYKWFEKIQCRQGERWKLDAEARTVGALTVDLEDWKCALDPDPSADFRVRPAIDEEYVRRSTKMLLNELDRYKSRATFFVLGEIALAVPEVVKEISGRGHEVASHSPVHLPPRYIPRSEFAALMKRDYDLLHELAGVPPKGFRAPYFAVRRSEGWLLKILAEVGFQYDSSVVPTRTPYWGIPMAPKKPYFPSFNDLAKPLPSGRILEIPLTVWPTWGYLPGLPISGGFYMRIWPTRMLLWMLNRNVSTKHSLVLYVHPGNLEEEKERVSNTSMRDKMSQYFAAGRGASAFKDVLGTFRFGTISEHFASYLSPP